MTTELEQKDIDKFNNDINIIVQSNDDQEEKFKEIISHTTSTLDTFSREEAKREILVMALKILKKLHSHEPTVYIWKYPSKNEFLIEYPDFKGSDDTRLEELRAYANWMNFLFAEKIIKPKSNRGAILFGLSMALGKFAAEYTVARILIKHFFT